MTLPGATGRRADHNTAESGELAADSLVDPLGGQDGLRGSRASSLCGSRRTSELDLADVEQSVSMSSASSRRGSECRLATPLGEPLGGPMQAIMDGAMVPTLPRYIFRAHEMTQDVRHILKVSVCAGAGRGWPWAVQQAVGYIAKLIHPLSQ